MREQINIKLAPLKKSLQKIENNIEALEKSKAKLEALLIDPDLYKDQQEFADKSSAYKKTEERLERLYPQWEELQAEIEAVADDSDI